MSDTKPKSSPSVGQTTENKVEAGAISNEVDHTGTLSNDIGVLFSNPDFSDIILVVNGEKISANKALLAARSEYFREEEIDLFGEKKNLVYRVTSRGLLYGGLKESGEADVVLNQTNVFAFRILLRYLYTAKLTLSDYEEDQLLEILSVAHQYCVNDLQNAIADYLKKILNNQNVCKIFELSRLYFLHDLELSCVAFAKQNRQQVLTSQGFLQLPTNEVTQLLSSLSNFFTNLSKFRGIRAWIMEHKELQIDTEEMVTKFVQLPRLSRDALLKEVRESGLVKAETILNAIEVQEGLKKEEENKKGKQTLPTVK